MEPTTAAALILILGLRASLPQHANLDSERVVLDSESGPVSNLEAAVVLSRRPKPMACNAGVLGKYMVITCGTPTGVQARIHEYQVAQSSSNSGLLGAALGGAGEFDSACVLVKGANQKLLVTPRAVSIFERDYVLVAENASTGVRPPEKGEERDGVSLVLSFGSVSMLTPEEFDSVLRSVSGGETRGTT